MTLRAVFSTTN